MIYDTFCFWNELDLLEIRLNILDQYVDYFVICEGSETFSGQRKLLNFLENVDRFKKWKDKIIYITPQLIETDDPFARAGYQKDYIRTRLLDYAKDDDIIYFGDLDEIWKPQEITDDKVYNLQQLNYSYYLNNRSSEAWVGTVVGKWKIFKTNSVNYWRANHTNELPDGGWHFTNIGGLDQILKKIESYDHCNEVNCDWVRDGMKARIENGEDYLGRSNDWQGKPFKMWTDEKELPHYLLENKDKYKKLWK
jgi:beta-1,4-mannosyl-glycoprotein beta-1,4-N-acetylglucosaminyltransferase